VPCDIEDPRAKEKAYHRGNHLHIAYGSKDTYVERCVEAIRSTMRTKYYSWPDASERRSLAAHFHQKYKLPNAILVPDGTTFRFGTKPLRADAADYSGRKEGFTMKNLFFSDCCRRIRYYVSGWAGCVHDNRMWKTCRLFRRPDDFFSPNEYIIGDSAFENGAHMVTTYRSPPGGVLVGTKKAFNDVLSSPRVISEHVNGILKGRWSWLNCIPCLLTEDVKTMERILKLIDVTVILHNFLAEENLNDDDDVFLAENGQQEELADGDVLNLAVENGAPLDCRREQLRS